MQCTTVVLGFIYCLQLAQPSYVHRPHVPHITLDSPMLAGPGSGRSSHSPPNTQYTSSTSRTMEPSPFRLVIVTARTISLQGSYYYNASRFEHPCHASVSPLLRIVKFQDTV